jgi:hypothetical protein
MTHSKQPICESCTPRRMQAGCVRSAWEQVGQARPRSSGHWVAGAHAPQHALLGDLERRGGRGERQAVAGVGHVWRSPTRNTRKYVPNGFLIRNERRGRRRRWCRELRRVTTRLRSSSSAASGTSFVFSRAPLVSPLHVLFARDSRRRHPSQGPSPPAPRWRLPTGTPSRPPSPALDPR